MQEGYRELAYGTKIKRRPVYPHCTSPRCCSDPLSARGVLKINVHRDAKTCPDCGFALVYAPIKGQVHRQGARKLSR